MFICDKCGECCRNLDKSSIYDSLHNGNGVCRYLKNNECSIYDERPLICRVDESYDIFFKERLPYEEYIQLNYECCKQLKMNAKKSLEE